MRNVIRAELFLLTVFVYLATALQPCMALTQNEVQKLLASDGSSLDFFGKSVAISGDTAIVGANADDIGRGAAYVFIRAGSTWVEQAKLVPSDRVEIDEFGAFVAISGDTVIIGALGDDFGRGAAYVFTRVGSTWTEQAKLLASDRAAGDRFGVSVAISGDTVIIGADRTSNLPVDNSRGAAYVFTRVGSTWTEQAKLLASDGVLSQGFGFSTAISAHIVIIGDYLNDNKRGAAYVFTRVGSTWTEQAKLLASDRAAGDELGRFAAISGDTVIVGAYLDDNHRGAAYMFTRVGSTWTEQAKLLASDGVAKDFLALSVEISGDTVIVGAIGDDGGRGAAYIFDVSSSTLPDVDSDGVADEFDNCPATPNPAQSDIDMDGAGDLCDACPAVAPPDQCDINGSAAGEVTIETGGSVQTPDGNLLIEANPGALAFDATLSVTETIKTDPEVDLIVGTNPGLGQGLAFYDLQPEGIVFTSGVSVTVKADVTALNQNQRNRLSVYLFTDTNGDGAADQFVEVDLVTCSFATELDGTVIATCTFQLLHFSEYAVIVPLDTDGDGIPDNFYPEQDACPLEDASGFDVDDNGCIDSYSGLTDLVGRLVTEGVISTTMQNSLLSKVANAQASADRTSVCAAINELEAFKKQVAAQTGKKISVDAAALVSAYVDSVIAVQLAQLPVGSTCL